MKKNGYKSKPINNEGDLVYRKTSKDPWIKVEVKTATVNLIGDENAWFNQIRVKQKSWNEVWLVSVYPNYIKIFRKTREDFLSNLAIMNSTSKCLTHIGTTDLAGVNLTLENQHEWELVYSDHKGR